MSVASREVFDGNQHAPTTVAEVLTLRPLARDSFLAEPVSTTGRRTIYGGQLAAQSLRAASLTVPDDRVAHSLHAYFIAPGDASAPVEFAVERHRDGGRYSGRLVTARQGDSVVLSMICSFAKSKPQPAEFQPTPKPSVQAPSELETVALDTARTFDLEARIPDDPEPWFRWPARMWLRIRESLGDDPNVRACGLAFLSDMGTGLSRAPGVEKAGLLPSIDHTMWLHRSADPTEWMLIDLAPLGTADGRGVYRGQLFDERGALVASLAQEQKFDIAD